MNINEKRAFKRLQAQTFEQQFRGVNAALPFISAFFSVLSVLTAIGFFVDMIEPVAGLVLACATGAVILVATESGERKACVAAFGKWFENKAKSDTQNGKVGFLRVLSAVFFVALSLSLSTVGSYYSYKKISNTKNKVKDVYSVQADSVQAVWDARISEAQSTADGFLKSNLVKVGKGKALRVDATHTYNALVQDVRIAKEGKDTALMEVRREELGSITKGVNKTDFNAYVAAVWVLAISVGKVVFVWFGWYYDYRAAFEYMQRTGEAPQYEHIEIMQEEPKRIETVAGFKITPETVKTSIKTAKTLRACKGCGSDITKKRKTAKFCCPNCKSEYHNKKTQEK